MAEELKLNSIKDDIVIKPYSEIYEVSQLLRMVRSIQHLGGRSDFIMKRNIVERAYHLLTGKIDKLHADSVDELQKSIRNLESVVTTYINSNEEAWSSFLTKQITINRKSEVIATAYTLNEIFKENYCTDQTKIAEVLQILFLSLHLYKIFRLEAEIDGDIKNILKRMVKDLGIESDNTKFTYLDLFNELFKSSGLPNCLVEKHKEVYTFLEDPFGFFWEHFKAWNTDGCIDKTHPLLLERQNAHELVIDLMKHHLQQVEYIRVIESNRLNLLELEEKRRTESASSFISLLEIIARSFDFYLIDKLKNLSWKDHLVHGYPDLDSLVRDLENSGNWDKLGYLYYTQGKVKEAMVYLNKSNSKFAQAIYKLYSYEKSDLVLFNMRDYFYMRAFILQDSTLSGYSLRSIIDEAIHSKHSICEIQINFRIHKPVIKYADLHTAFHSEFAANILAIDKLGLAFDLDALINCVPTYDSSKLKNLRNSALNDSFFEMIWKFYAEHWKTRLLSAST